MTIRLFGTGIDPADPWRLVASQVQVAGTHLDALAEGALLSSWRPQDRVSRAARSSPHP